MNKVQNTNNNTNTNNTNTNTNTNNTNAPTVFFDSWGRGFVICDHAPTWFYHRPLREMTALERAVLLGSASFQETDLSRAEKLAVKGCGQFRDRGENELAYYEPNTY